MKHIAFIAAILTATPSMGGPKEVSAVREAALTEALHAARALVPARPDVSFHCLALEGHADPPPKMLERLQKHVDRAVLPYSRCAREQLLVQEGLTGPFNLIALTSLAWSAKGVAEVRVQVLGGAGCIAVSRTRRGWQTTWCSGGLIS
jgi:hypothetical protein